MTSKLSNDKEGQGSLVGAVHVRGPYHIFGKAYKDGAQFSPFTASKLSRFEII